MRFLSFGAGVQTTALLLMDSYDEVIFADTQGENPETYEYLEKYTLPYVKDKGIKFTILDAPVQNKEDGYESRSLEDWCLHYKSTPDRLHRWCTDKFKIRRIRKYISDSGQVPSICVIGYSADEAWRMHKPHWAEYTNEYPLIEKALTKKDCEQIILKSGLPVPPKSGCWYCPFAKKQKFAQLYYNHPELFERARQMEERSSGFPRWTLKDKPLSRITESLGEGSMKLDLFIEAEPDECDEGVCFV